METLVTNALFHVKDLGRITECHEACQTVHTERI